MQEGKGDNQMNTLPESFLESAVDMPKTLRDKKLMVLTSIEDALQLYITIEVEVPHI